MFDVLIAGGDVHDGTGGEPLRADVGVVGDRVAVVGPNLAPEAAAVIDATGKAVCPGFINILSHSYFSILHDPRSLGELTQGVTTEVFGEGTSMGPLTPRMKAELRGREIAVSQLGCIGETKQQPASVQQVRIVPKADHFVLEVD